MKKNFSILAIILLERCSYASTPNDHSSVVYEPNISKDIVFELMDYNYKNSCNDDIDSTAKTSTNVKLVAINDSLDGFSIIDKMDCSSWIESDSLWIHISRGDGFTGDGVNIKMKNGQFNCTPFHSTDVIKVGEKEPIIHIEKQELFLNKKSLQIGDSLYGYMYVRATENGQLRKYVAGYFRTKIQKN